jgi:hypothetical protein
MSKLGVMKKDRRKQSELFFQDEYFVININYAECENDLPLHLFQENKSYGVKTIELILVYTLLYIMSRKLMPYCFIAVAMLIFSFFVVQV